MKNKSHVTKWSDLIRGWGVPAFARDMNIKYVTAQQMMQRNSVSHRYWLDIERIASEHPEFNYIDRNYIIEVLARTSGKKCQTMAA